MNLPQYYYRDDRWDFMIKDEALYFLKRKVYVLPVLTALICTFGFSVTHISQGMDDLCRCFYTKDFFYIRFADRIGGWLVMYLLGKNGHENVFQSLFGIVGLFMGVLSGSMLFRRASEDKLPFFFTLCFPYCLLLRQRMRLYRYLATQVLW